jgi:hypothetical protein
MLSYILATLLTVVALYLIIRLLEWDRVNRDTPDQEDPLFKDGDDS